KELKQITLKVFLKDAFGNQITNKEYEELSCSLEESEVEQFTSKGRNKLSLKNNFEFKDNIPSLYYLPTVAGEYTFIPKVKCKNDRYAIPIKCDLCTFRNPTRDLEGSRVKLFSDFKEKSYISTDLTMSNPLMI